MSHVCNAFARSTEAEASMTSTTSARTSWHGVVVAVVVGDVVCVVVSHRCSSSTIVAPTATAVCGASTDWYTSRCGAIRANVARSILVPIPKDHIDTDGIRSLNRASSRSRSALAVPAALRTLPSESTMTWSAWPRYPASTTVPFNNDSRILARPV